MATLIGFEPSIKLEMRFTGLELLHLFHGSKMHYDSACRAASKHACQGLVKNGIIIRAMMHLGGSYKRYDARIAGESDEKFLSQNLDATADISLTWREIDLLCKVAEQFDLILGGMKQQPPQHFSMNVAVRIALGLHRALNEAGSQIDILREQEVLRRQEQTLSVNAN